MGKTIKCTLSQKSIQKAIDEIKNYQKSLRNKNEIFIKRLCELGIPVINQNILAAQGDSDKNHNTYIKINSSVTISLHQFDSETVKKSFITPILHQTHTKM